MKRHPQNVGLQIDRLKFVIEDELTNLFLKSDVADDTEHDDEQNVFANLIQQQIANNQSEFVLWETNFKERFAMTHGRMKAMQAFIQPNT